MDWQPIKDAPRDRPILLWGKLCGERVTDLHPAGKMRVVGGWTEIPDAPCSQLERALLSTKGRVA